MDFEIVLQNPCNSGNAVIISDPDPNRIDVGRLTIMSEWSNKVIDLDSLFTDRVTKEGSLGSCGSLTYELQENTSLEGVEYTMIKLDQETRQLIVESNDPAEEGLYEFKLVVSLPQWPGATPYSEYITAEILSVNIINKGTTAWVLLPIFVILFFILGIFLGIMYQRKKTGLPINPFSKSDKITGQVDEEEFYDDVVPLGGISHSHEIIR